MAVTRGTPIWLGALLLALGFLVLDSDARLRSIAEINELAATQSSAAPATDQPRTDYALHQHHLILPSLGVDGYHWLMHAEQMFAAREFRVRQSSAENPPTGREVHWSGSIRWWLSGVAVIYRASRPQMSLSRALERVAPIAGTLLLALFIVVLTPIIARRFDAVSAALFAFGSVAVHPFYQFHAAGLLDHHGLAAMCALLLVLAIIAGGSGFVRVEAATTAASQPVEPAAGRRWFIASAIAGGAGLWVSAATLVPVLFGVGVGVLIASLWCRDTARKPGWQAEPSLWRLWGITGCITSICFYLLEYFPRDMGMRLEVNHPLYALAWLGAGDLLYRLSAWISKRTGRQDSERALNVRMLAGDIALMAALPLVILLTGDTTFRIANPFLWALHTDYIAEFRSLGAEFSQLNAVHPLQGVVTLLPLLFLPIAALLWPRATDGSQRIRRGALLGLIVAALCYAHAFFFPVVAGIAQSLALLPRDNAQATLLVHVLTIAIDAALYQLLFRSWLRRGLPELAAPLQSMLWLSVAPAVTLLSLAFWQIRWLGVASALLLVVLITLAALLRAIAPAFVWTGARRVTAVVLLFFVLAPFPLFAALLTWRFGYPSEIDRTQVVARDVAQLVRMRAGASTPVVVSAPTATSWLIYFGGMRGLGTLYWENTDGLQSSAAIYGAATDEQARQLIDRHGVTHIVVFSWEPFALEYAALARGLRANQSVSEPPTFILRLLRDQVPPWLTRVEYDMPGVGLPADARVWIFEVNARASGT